MRLALLLAISALVAGCSSESGRPTAETGSSAATGTSSSSMRVPTPPSSSEPSSGTPAPASGGLPADGAPITDVIAWLEAGTPADVVGFHAMTRGGEVTNLGDGVAFTTAGGVTNCVTNRYLDGALACLVKLADPPPRPAGIETAWKSNWVDFAGTTVDVGSLHGDPGPFVDGTGAELPAGQTLAFGDYRCRAHPAGVVCVDYAHQTAVALSAAGVKPFGCLTATTPPADIGRRFSC